MKKMTNEEFIELCLERLSMGKTSDVVNFSYADTLAYIRRLKAENAELKEKDIHCANSMDDMIKRCDSCGLSECIGCEHSRAAVMEVKNLKEGYIKEFYGEMLPLHDGYDVEIKSIEAIADPADPTGMNIKVFVAAYCTYLNYGEDRRRSTDKLYVIMASKNKGKDWDVCRDRNRCVIVEETWREARKTKEKLYYMQREEADMLGLAYIPRKYFKIVEFSPTEVEINAKKDKTQKQ